MNPQLQIQIPEPCHQPWQDMSMVSQNTRHCNTCDKVITDFTAMSDEELIHYLTTHKNVCGRFSNNQLNRQLEVKQVPDYRQPRKRIWPQLVLPAFLSAVAVELQAQKQDSTVIHQPVYAVEADTTAKEQRKISISGNVTGEDSVAVAAVIVIGTCSSDTAYVTGDFDGNFKLEIVASDSDSIRLEFKCIGYETAYDTCVVRNEENEYRVDVIMREKELSPMIGIVSTSRLPTVGFAVIETSEPVKINPFRFFLYRITHPFRKLRRKP